jgi:hypothetical protein
MTEWNGKPERAGWHWLERDTETIPLYEIGSAEPIRHVPRGTTDGTEPVKKEDNA